MSKFVISLVSVLLSTAALAGEDTIVLSSENSVAMHDTFRYSSVGKLQQSIYEKHQNRDLKKENPIYIVMDSPGGGISAGLEAIDNLRAIDRELKTITLFSASMGFQLVQALGERLITPNGTLMSHKAAGWFSGEFPNGTLNTRLDHWMKRVLRLDAEVAKRADMSTDKYGQLIDNEYWCDGADCAKDKFADRVVKVVCDSTLSGVEFKSDSFSFWGLTIEESWSQSKCPLITGWMDYKVTISGDESGVLRLVHAKELQRLQEFRTGRMTNQDRAKFAAEFFGGQ